MNSQKNSATLFLFCSLLLCGGLSADVQDRFSPSPAVTQTRITDLGMLAVGDTNLLRSGSGQGVRLLRTDKGLHLRPQSNNVAFQLSEDSPATVTVLQHQTNCPPDTDCTPDTMLWLNPQQLAALSGENSIHITIDHGSINADNCDDQPCPRAIDLAVSSSGHRIDLDGHAYTFQLEGLELDQPQVVLIEKQRPGPLARRSYFQR